MTERTHITELIEVASGRRKADLVIKHARIVDVLNHKIIEGSLAITGGRIAGIGAYEGHTEIDAHHKYLLPGLIDSHVHIESAMTSPESFASAVVPRGTTTVIADPHEISNVCGLDGIQYMLDATEQVPLRVFMMLPSCVPATDFEHAGAVLGTEELRQFMGHPRVLGLGEMMDYPAVVNGSDPVIDKLLLALEAGKQIDGHSPMLEGRDLSAYAAAGISTDHECSTVDEMQDRISRGMYVLIREGSAAHNLSDLLRGVTESNSRRCLFCTDDRQPEDILKSGHIDNHLRLAVSHGIDPVTAVQMATINAAECYGLKRTGAIAPGYAADFVIASDLEQFVIEQVFINGKLEAAEGLMVHEMSNSNIQAVTDTVHVSGFTRESLRLPLRSALARVIRINARSLVTEQAIRKVFRDERGDFRHDDRLDLLKMVVVERHKHTGNVGIGIVENYHLTGGAIATTIAHDSHNIIAIGDTDEDIFLAIEHLISISGGITMVAGGKVLDALPLPIAGLMSDQSAEYVDRKLQAMHEVAFERFGINRDIDPFMTLSFMALPVIPEIKLTDMGLFDVRTFSFIDISVD
ncbi:MAG: adenine deaminase [Spirochaetia bacterium]|nr:adenine deaminase [Spirochaetia bacterium]